MVEWKKKQLSWGLDQLKPYACSGRYEVSCWLRGILHKVCVKHRLFLLSHVPKPKKNVLLLSTQHDQQPAISQRADCKPEVVLTYNENTGAVNIFNKMIDTYHSKVSPRRSVAHGAVLHHSGYRRLECFHYPVVQKPQLEGIKENTTSMHLSSRARWVSKVCARKQNTSLMKNKPAISAVWAMQFREQCRPC